MASKTIRVFCAVIAFTLAFVSDYANASDTGLERPSVLGIELLGRAGAYSIFFDRHVVESVALGVGFEYAATMSSGTSSLSAMVFPVYTNLYFAPGPSRAYATAGLNLVVGNYSSGSTNVNGSGLGSVTAGLGWEYRGSGGLLFRATGYVIAGSSVSPWLGLSFGAAMP